MSAASHLPGELEHADPAEFELARRKCGKGWTYHNAATGRRVRDARTVSQLRSIGVPATWTDVRLSLNPRSHIQAAGYDGSGKLQYLYHQDFLDHRNRLKFEELPTFGAASCPTAHGSLVSCYPGISTMAPPG
jgi:DNA topoisomerase-1